MAEYSRITQRFYFAGLSLMPIDALGAGKLPFVRNVRSYQEGTLQPRDGSVQISTTAVAGGGYVHTLARLNDPTPFAGHAAIRLAGAGGALSSAPPQAGLTPWVYSQIDTGYSGDPLSIVMATPVRSPQPWAYIYDRSRQRKTNTNGVLSGIGLIQPSVVSTEPTVRLGKPGITVINDFNAVGTWVPAGSIAAVATAESRVNTAIQAILYDNGAGADSYASIQPVNIAFIGNGTLLTLAGVEAVVVTDVCVAIATTTIAAIQYDNPGGPGLCTIQPTASLGTGQLDGPDPILLDQRYGYDKSIGTWQAAGAPPVPGGAPPLPSDPSALLATQGLSRVRQLDFPVNCLVTLNGAETVRILSVAVGPNGIQSFRCNTVGTYAAGQAITGVASLRAYVVGNYGPGATMTANAIGNSITPTQTANQEVGGIQNPNVVVNGALVGALATTPDDEIHLSIKIDFLAPVQEIRVYLDVDATTNDFLHNYYMAVWRANDIIAAIQAANAAATGLLQDSRENAIVNNQVDQPVANPNTGSTTGNNDNNPQA